jgi:hypothetical protein
MLVGMEKPARKRSSIAYVVVAILMTLMMFFSASTKLTLNPGAVHVIHEVVGVPMSFFPWLAACEIAGGIGLLAGIFRPKLGVAASVGLLETIRAHAAAAASTRSAACAMRRHDAPGC